MKGMKWKEERRFDTAHNYMAEKEGGWMLRKGAVSAALGETLLIPINMKEGALICTGKGNPDWNESAPHGSGRRASRTDTEQSHTVSEFKKEMKGIYCSVVGRETLDEAPFAYCSMDNIVNKLEETVEINKIIRPVYNYKAGR